MGKYISFDFIKYQQAFLTLFKQKLMRNGSVIANEMKSRLLDESTGMHELFESEVKRYINFAFIQSGENSLGIKIGLLNPDKSAYYKAMMMNYGTGPYMDDSNKWLPDYKNSNEYNELRQNENITSRLKEDPYYDPVKKEMVHGSVDSAAEAITYEQFAFPGNHWFENALRLHGISNIASSKRLLQEVASETLKELKLENYIESKVRWIKIGAR